MGEYHTAVALTISELDDLCYEAATLFERLMLRRYTLRVHRLRLRALARFRRRMDRWVAAIEHKEGWAPYEETNNRPA